jgi:hypothetical protein
MDTTEYAQVDIIIWGRKHPVSTTFRFSRMSENVQVPKNPPIISNTESNLLRFSDICVLLWVNAPDYGHLVNETCAITE